MAHLSASAFLWYVMESKIVQTAVTKSIVVRIYRFINTLFTHETGGVILHIYLNSWILYQGDKRIGKYDNIDNNFFCFRSSFRWPVLDRSCRIIINIVGIWCVIYKFKSKLEHSTKDGGQDHSLSVLW